MGKEHVTKEQGEWSTPHLNPLLQIEHRQSVYFGRLQIPRFIFTGKSLFYNDGNFSQIKLNAINANPVLRKVILSGNTHLKLLVLEESPSERSQRLIVLASLQANR